MRRTLLSRSTLGTSTTAHLSHTLQMPFLVCRSGSEAGSAATNERRSPLAFAPLLSMSMSSKISASVSCSTTSQGIKWQRKCKERRCLTDRVHQIPERGGDHRHLLLHGAFSDLTHCSSALAGWSAAAQHHQTSPHTKHHHTSNSKITPRINHTHAPLRILMHATHTDTHTCTHKHNSPGRCPRCRQHRTRQTFRPRWPSWPCRSSGP